LIAAAAAKFSDGPNLSAAVVADGVKMIGHILLFGKKSVCLALYFGGIDVVFPALVPWGCGGSAAA
jgi:hypothetical protein